MTILNEKLKSQMKRDLKELIKHLRRGFISPPAPKSSVRLRSRAGGEPLRAAFIRAGINAH